VYKHARKHTPQAFAALSKMLQKWPQAWKKWPQAGENGHKVTEMATKITRFELEFL